MQLLHSNSNAHPYAFRNEIHPSSNLLPLGVMKYRLFLIGLSFPFFAGMSVLLTYPARFSLCSKESFNAADTLYIFPDVFNAIISDISVEFNGFSDSYSAIKIMKLLESCAPCIIS
jgi:hypothetical protein